MKKIVLFSVFAVITTALVTGCSNTSETKSFVNKYLLGEKDPEVVPDYNIVIIVDGTDLKHKEYAVPMVTVEYIAQFADKIQQKGKGRLWLGYVDESSENNSIAYLEIFQAPHEITDKMRSETKLEYSERLKKMATDSMAFEKDKSQRLFTFLEEAQKIIQVAYSTKVITAKRGSDVDGALNAGMRLLKTVSIDSDTKKYVVLVSDGVDNIGKKINGIPDNVKVLLVNNSGSKNHLGDEIIDLDNLTRMEEYIFSGK